MKRVLAVLLCLLLVCGMLALVACDRNGEDDTDTDDSGATPDGHVHTYKTDAEWTKDASGHWYDVTCGCVNATVRKLQHVDDNKDAICDVCKFEYDHEHTYSEDWTVDCTNHWNAADCGCIIPGANTEEHVDENGDGECDTCKYVIEDLHNHYYDTKWSNDTEYHWHAALCEHNAEVADKAAHEINAAGYCTVCDAKIKEVDRTDLAAIIAAAVANNYKVVSGNVRYDEIVYDTPTAILTSKTDEVFFVLGNGDSYILLKNYNANGSFIGGEQQYFETLDNGEYFGIMMPIGGIDLNITQPTAEKFNGYNYVPGSILAAGYDDTSTLAQTIANFYDLMKTQPDVKNVVENYDPETGKYSFSFEYLAVNATLQHPADGSGGDGEWFYEAYVYFVDVEFSVNEEFVIDICNFTVESYRDWEFDQDITYDPETNTYEMLSTASPTYYKYEVSQTAGERTFTTIYPKASFVPSDFELFHVTGTDYDDDAHLIITDEVEILDTDGDGIVDLVLDPYTFVRLHIGNVIPSSAITSFMDAPVVTYENLNGSGTPWGSASNFQAPTFSAYMNVISFFTIDSGEYLFTIDAGAVQKKIHVTITGEPAPDVSLDTPTDFHVKVTDSGSYSDEYKFVADKAGVYTFNLPAGLGFSSESGTFVAPGVAYGSNENGATLVFECWAGREFTYYVTAGTRGWYNITVDYEAANIQKPLDPSEAMTGVYDAAAGATTGTLTIDGTAGTIVFVCNEGTKNYTFTVENGKVSLSNDYGPISSSMAKYFGILTIDENNVPLTFTFNEVVYTLTLQGSEPTPDPTPDPEPGEDEDGLQGSGTESDPYILTESGEYVADYKGGPNLVYYSFTATENGIITFTSKFNGTPWMVLDNVSNEGYLEEFSKFVPAGTTVIFQMGDWSDQAGDVPFEMSFVAKDSDDFSALVGTWYGQSNDFWTVDYTLVINADGTGTLTYVAFDNTTDATLTYVFVDGENVTIGYQTTGTTGTLVCTYDGTAFVCTQGAMMDAFTFQTTPIENGGEGGDEGGDEPTYEVDPVKDAICGEYDDALDGYVLSIYNTYSEDGYIVNVYKTNDDGMYVVDLYFTFEVTDNDDGTYTLTLTHAPKDYEAGAENVADILASDIIVTPKVVSPLESLLGAESTINGNTISFNYDYEELCYYINVYGGADDLYYKVIPTENNDGTISLAVSFWADYWMYFGNEKTDVYELDGKTVIATKDGSSWTFALEGEEPAPSEPTGTFNDPIALEENNTCQFPGGWNYIFYSYTAAANGTLTITVTDNGDLYWAYGFEQYAMEQVQGLTADITLTAGKTVYIGMSTNSAAADTISFTSSFEESTEEPTPVEPDGSSDNPFSLVMGENQLVYQGYSYAWALYKYTATEDGTLTITMITTNFDLGYGSAPMMINGSQSSPLAIQVTAGQTVWIGLTTASGSSSATPIVFTAEFGNGAGEEVTDEPREADLVLGNNAINAENINFTYTATADIKLSLTLGNQIMGEVVVTYSVNGGTAIAIANGSTVEVELKANDVLVVSAETTMGYQSITVAEVVDEPQGPTLQGSGTSSNPYVVTELPLTLTFQGKHDYYYTYTATEDIVITINAPAGLVSETGAVKDSNNNYVINLTAGQTLKMNIWTTSTAATEYVYTITGAAPVVTPDPEPGEGGEAGSGEAVVYLASHSSGRKFQITIDSAAGKITIIRSDLTGSLTTGGATTYTANYSFDGTTVTYDGTYAMQFDENGAPIQLTWGTAVVTGFEKQ